MREKYNNVVSFFRMPIKQMALQKNMVIVD